jgi:DNA polymerase-1
MKVALIDGDVLAYQSCHNRDTHRIWVPEVGFTSPTYTEEEDAEYIAICWKTFKKRLEKLVATVYCEHYLMAVKGADNFRNALYPDYKMNRHADVKRANLVVPALRKLAVHHDLAIESTGREADDLLRMWANECAEVGRDYVICSIDKDLRCIPGTHYLMHHEEFLVVSEKEAMLHYHRQLLKGDPTDNIPGLPGVGDKTAEKLLSDCATEEECQEVVVGSYLQAFGDDWYEYLLSNAKMIHLQNHVTDFGVTEDWPLVKELIHGQRSLGLSDSDGR